MADMQADTITQHFGQFQYHPIPRFRSVITNTCNSYLKWKEEQLGMTCTQAFWQRNPLGESFLFGRFSKGKEWIPVTLAYYHPGVGWITMRREMEEFRLAHDPTPAR